MVMENEQKVQPTTRKAWVDVLRAIALIFVMYGHIVGPKTVFYVFTSPIKIPLFFAISGYVFNNQKKTIGVFFARLTSKLVIPWLILSIPKAVLLTSRGMGEVGNYVIETLVGQRNWYLPCCIVAEIIFFFVLKFSKKQWHVVVCTLGLTAIGLLLPKTAITELFRFRTALVVQSFLLIGYAFRKNEERIDQVKLRWFFGGAAAYVLLGVGSLWLFPGQCLDVNTGSYYNYPICAAMIFIGCVVLFALFRKINCFPKLLEKLGRNTLVFYIFHPDAVYALMVVGVSFPDAWWGEIAKLLGAFVGCTVIAAVLNRFLPEAVGRKRVRKHTTES